MAQLVSFISYIYPSSYFQIKVPYKCQFLRKSKQKLIILLNFIKTFCVVKIPIISRTPTKPIASVCVLLLEQEETSALRAIFFPPPEPASSHCLCSALGREEKLESAVNCQPSYRGEALSAGRSPPKHF